MVRIDYQKILQDTIVCKFKIIRIIIMTEKCGLTDTNNDGLIITQKGLKMVWSTICNVIWSVLLKDESKPSMALWMYHKP